MCFFSLFFIEEILKQYYFSNEVLQSSYVDFSFYIETVEAIINSGVESSMSYLNLYGYESGKSIYHYFDLYLLMPGISLGISSQISYLFFLVPFSYTLGAFLMVQLIGSQLSKWVRLIFVYALFHLVGIDFLRLIPISSSNFLTFHKALLLLMPLSFLKQWYVEKDIKYLVAIVLLSVCINPILSIILNVYIVGILLIGLRQKSMKIKQFFAPQYLIAYAAFLIYAYVFLIQAKDTGNQFLYPKFDLSISDYLKGFFKRFTTYLVGLRVYPSLLLGLLASLFLYKKTKTMNKEVKTCLVVFLIAHLISSSIFFHSESSQFFSICMITMVALVSYYGMLRISDVARLSKGIGVLTILVVLGANMFNKFNTYTKPHHAEPISLSYFRKIEANIKSYDGHRKILYFENLNTRWRRLMPHLPFGIGYTNLFPNTHVLQGTLLSFFTERLEDFSTTGTTSIAISPFQQFCNKHSYSPKSYDDPIFEKALREFVKEQNISMFIFNNNMDLPKWVERFEVKSIVKGVNEQDKHTFIFL